MAVAVHIDGRLFDQDAARVSVFDRGFLYGDSVYEVMRTSRGVPVDLDRHLARLVGSGERIGLDIPPDAQIRAAIADTLTAAQNLGNADKGAVFAGIMRGDLDKGIAGKPSRITDINYKQDIPDHPGRVKSDRSAVIATTAMIASVANAKSAANVSIVRRATTTTAAITLARKNRSISIVSLPTVTCSARTSLTLSPPCSRAATARRTRLRAWLSSWCDVAA